MLAINGYLRFAVSSADHKENCLGCGAHYGNKRKAE